MKFGFDIEILNSGIIVANISGDLFGDLDGIPFMKELVRLIENKHIKAIFDLSELKFIDSAGMGLLITSLTKLRNKGGELILLKPADQLKRLLVMTKLEAIFTIVENKEEAISILNNN